MKNAKYLKDALKLGILAASLYASYQNRVSDDKPRLDIVVTKNYNIEGTWAHTRPGERIIVMLPEELRDYRLPIEDHEIVHNAFPGLRNEGYVTGIASGPSMPHIRKMFDYSYRRA